MNPKIIKIEKNIAKNKKVLALFDKIANPKNMMVVAKLLSMGGPLFAGIAVFLISTSLIIIKQNIFKFVFLPIISIMGIYFIVGILIPNIIEIRNKKLEDKLLELKKNQQISFQDTSITEK